MKQNDFILNAPAIRCALSPYQLAGKANDSDPANPRVATSACLNFYFATAHDTAYGQPGDKLYVPAFELVEREELGEPVEPVVGLHWTDPTDNVTRVILSTNSTGGGTYASNSTRVFTVHKTGDFEHLLRTTKGPRKPSRKIREWQPINRVSGP